MNQKCHNCGLISDELKCYDCYKKVRNIFVPGHVIEVQQQFIAEHEIELKQLVADKFEDLKNFNAIERISLYQKKLCEVNDDLRDLKYNFVNIKTQKKEIQEQNVQKRAKIELLKVNLERLKNDIQKTDGELQKRQDHLLNLKKLKVEQNYNLRNINYAFPDWAINNELEKIEIPFYSKKSKAGEKQYQNYILFKQKQTFLTQIQQQQFIFSLNQISLFIYRLLKIFKISSHFPLIKKAKEQVTISGDIRLIDDTFRIIYDENIIYIYLNYKLILQRFNIRATRNPYFFFDFGYFKEKFLNINLKRQYQNQNEQSQEIQSLKQIQADQFNMNITEYTDDDQEFFQNVLQKNNSYNVQRDHIYMNSPQKLSLQQFQIDGIQQSQILNNNQEKLLIRSLCTIDEINKYPMSQSEQSNNKLKSGKSYNLLFVKSPLIRIEYEDNLKQKEIGFNDPYIYKTNKVISGGWELYDADDY